ncbi:MAG: pilus assembly PilX N-terminal domain-containing protein [Patescibacteria group bacterium]
MKNTNKNRGFTLFIAIIITGALVLIAAGIGSLATRHAQIASSGQSSQHAFYAADTGMECALYWDVKNPAGYSAFSTSTPTSPITCNNKNIVVSPVVSGTPPRNGTTTISFDFTPADPYCVVVTIAKWYVGGTPKTKIESKGYNTCSASNPRRVERAVRAQY